MRLVIIIVILVLSFVVGFALGALVTINQCDKMPPEFIKNKKGGA